MREQSLNAVYRIPLQAIQAILAGSGDATTSAIKMNAANLLARPNGIALTADGRAVIISDSQKDLARWEVPLDLADRMHLTAGSGARYRRKTGRSSHASSPSCRRSSGAINPAIRTASRSSGTLSVAPIHAEQVDKHGNMWATANGGVHVFNTQRQACTMARVRC